MHFVGQDVISRATRGSGRTLVALSFVVWFVKFSEAPIENLVISGVTLPGSSHGYGFLQWIVLPLMLTYHFMNWWGDRYACKGWNDRNKVTDTAAFGAATRLMTLLESVLNIVKENPGSPQALMRLKEINTGVRDLHKFAQWYIWIWILFPTVCCIVALLWDTIVFIWDIVF